ncbi:hypothetical protein [Streptomyces sp. LBL]|uniref:hypothetical protein n=1 Tax=Streptomyces sp. LBL TaxID=2940562 RepID=UPI002473B843|nr:hypothetical protein [Streptomyces sp. LBL]
MGVPVAAMPYFHQAQGAQPAVARSIAVLREQGVLVLDGPDGYESHPPKRGNPKAYPWEKALAGVRTLRKPGRFRPCGT